MHHNIAPTAGTYDILNAGTFTSQTWEVTAEQVRVYSVQSGAYAPQFLYTMTPKQAAELLRVGERLGFAAPVRRAEQLRAIGKASAYELHKELGRQGFRDHYRTASEVLERPVSSLAALNAEEAGAVRIYARIMAGASA